MLLALFHSIDTLVNLFYALYNYLTLKKILKIIDSLLCIINNI